MLNIKKVLDFLRIHLNTIIWTQNIKECVPLVHLEKSGMRTGMGTSLQMRIFLFGHGRGHILSAESILPFWTVNRKWNLLESSLFMSGYIHVWYLFHMSKVTPECMPPTRGDFGHGPFSNLKGSLDIMSIHMGLLYLCDYYTTPEIEILFFCSGWALKVWPLFQ